MMNEGMALVYKWVWGAPLIALLFGLGLYLTIALRGIQFGLAEGIARMEGNGAAHRIGTRVVKAGELHVAHKQLRALCDAEADVHQGGVVRFRLFFYFHMRLLKTPAHVFGYQRIAIICQVSRR